MSYERLMAMQIKDEAAYEKYRAAMFPILQKYGGGFRYDFQVSKVLKAEAAHPINRVFAIYFRDEAAKDAFFADPEYVAIREKFFVPAVEAATQIAGYERK